MSNENSEFDFAPAATPEELRDVLTGLATIAPDLNAATDRAAATISEIEDYLNGLHLGVTGRSEEVPFAFGVRIRPDGRNEQGWMMLVYDRFCGRFAIHGVNRFDVFDEDDIPAESSRHEQVAWSSLCREDKLGSIGLLPSLLLDIHHNANHALTTSRAVIDQIGTLTAVMAEDDGKTRDASTQLVADWVRSCCDLVPGAENPIMGLFKSFRQYRDSIGDREPGGVILSAGDFGDHLGRLGHPIRMIKFKVTVVTGLRLRPGQLGAGAKSCWDGDDGDGGKYRSHSPSVANQIPNVIAALSGTTPEAATATPIGSLDRADAMSPRVDAPDCRGRGRRSGH